MQLGRKLAVLGLAFSIAIGGSQALANQDLFIELEQQAQTIRELELLEPMDISVVSREEHRDAQVEALEADMASEDSADWNTLLIYLGFIEEGQDINEIYMGFISEQVLGTYDPETKQLVIVSTATDDWNVTDKTTFVHETVHALQDQNFDIMSVYGDLNYVTDDRFYAARSLIEGDATVAEIQYIIQYDLLDDLLSEYEDADIASTDGIPFFLMETMTFYYEEGATFVTGIRTEGGWDAVNDVWANPPTTSEQIMNPEKYWEGEGAIPVALADPQPLFGDDWRIIEDNAWGQLGTRVFLENGGASSRVADSAASGWGGDGVYVITNDDETVMVWTSAWDTEDDAIEFFGTLTDVEAGRLGLTADYVDENHVLLSGDGWNGEINRDGEVVTYYLTETDESMELLIESQLNAELQPVGPPMDATPAATPAHKVLFWLREN